MSRFERGHFSLRLEDRHAARGINVSRAELEYSYKPDEKTEWFVTVFQGLSPVSYDTGFYLGTARKL